MSDEFFSQSDEERLARLREFAARPSETESLAHIETRRFLLRIIDELRVKLDAWKLIADERFEDLAKLYPEVDRLRAENNAMRKAASDYFGRNGAEHEDDDCPQDDTCECKLVQAIIEAFWPNAGNRRSR